MHHGCKARLCATLVLVAAWPAPARSLLAQQAPQSAFRLSVDSIMRGPELVGTAPHTIRISDDSRWVYFRWRRPGLDTMDLSYRAPLEGGEPEQVAPSEADTTYPVPGSWSRDRRHKVFALRGDLWLFDARAGSRRRLTDTPGSESGPSFLADGRTVTFVSDGNLFSLALDAPLLRQLTDIRRGQRRDSLTTRDTTGQRGFLRAEERRLFEVIGRARREETGPFGPRPDTAAPRPFYLRENQTVQGWDVSPDGRWLLLTIGERVPQARRAVMPVWITQSGYVETREIRTKVGDEQGARRVALMDLATGEASWPEFDTDSLHADVVGVGWSSSGRYALVRGVSLDFEHRWLWSLSPPSAVRELDHLHDSAWIGQLSLSAGWIEGRDEAWFTSERSGWSHLYAVPAEGGAARAVTPADGRFEVRDVEPSPDGRRFYYHANSTHFGEQHLYAVSADGGPPEQLTRSDGREDAEVSPDGRRLAVLHSRSNLPPELYVQPNRAGAPWRRVTLSTTAEWRRYPWREPELVMVGASDGVEVPARLYRPSSPNGAAVIFVHGAGYLQNAHRWWSSYYREYMFHHLLAERGYAVLDMDYRASAGLGRDWRAAIYRYMGGRDLDDQVDGARWLVRNLGVDSSRIGIYGGSYGGFITLMAMFTRPGVFAAGAALRPVTDWAHYNHGYTARILNEPQHDSVAYRRSSPIYHAEGLRGALLIAHGMVDDNVNYQDVVRLAQRLIELRKENWELASYPAEPHGFREAASWADEYRRILRLFETHLAR